MYSDKQRDIMSTKQVFYFEHTDLYGECITVSLIGLPLWRQPNVAQLILSRHIGLSHRFDGVKYVSHSGCKMRFIWLIAICPITLLTHASLLTLNGESKKSCPLLSTLHQLLWLVLSCLSCPVILTGHEGKQSLILKMGRMIRAYNQTGNSDYLKLHSVSHELTVMGVKISQPHKENSWECKHEDHYKQQTTSPDLWL